MTATRPRDLLLAGVVAALLTNVLVALTYGTLPDLPLAAGTTLGVVGVGEIVAGSVLRRRIRGGPGGPRVDPLLAADALVVAKASAVGGALVAGAWAGVLAYTLPRAGALSAAAGDSAAAGVGLACALLLGGSGLWLQRCLRAPDSPDPDRSDPH